MLRLVRFPRAILAHPLPALLALTIAVRLAALLLFPGVFRYEQSGAIHGSDAYDRYALGLIGTGVYGLSPGVPDASVTPFYGLLVAAIYSVFGRGGWPIGLAHTALDCLTVASVYWLGGRLFAGWGAQRAQAAGALAAAFTALYPYLVFQNLTLIDTPLFMALMFGWLVLVVRLRDAPARGLDTLWLGLAAGLLLALAMLTRAVMAPMAALLPLWFLLRRGPLDSLLRLLPVAAVPLLLFAPWVARNIVVYGEPVTTSLTFGTNLYQGNNPDVLPFLRAGYDPQWTGEPVTEVDPGSPQADRIRTARALDFLRENAGLIPALLWEKFLAHWSIEIFPRQNPATSPDSAGYAGSAQRSDADGLALGGLPQGDPVAAYSSGLFDALARPVHALYFGALLAFGVAGVLLSARGWREVSLLWLLLASMTAVYVIFHPSTRYRVPTDPALFLFSAFALVQAWAALRARWRATPR